MEGVPLGWGCTFEGGVYAPSDGRCTFQGGMYVPFGGVNVHLGG